MTIVLFIAGYLLFGLGYLFWAAYYDKLYDMYSPLQPVGFLFLWPIHLILLLFNFIKNL